VELMGGSIEVSSVVGEGTTFSFTISTGSSLLKDEGTDLREEGEEEKYTTAEHLVFLRLNNEKISHMISQALELDYHYITQVGDLEQMNEVLSMGGMYNTISLLIEPDDVPSIQIAALEAARSRGVVVKIYLSVSYNNPTLPPLPSHLTSIPVITLKRPYNISCIARIIRTVDTFTTSSGSSSASNRSSMDSNAPSRISSAITNLQSSLRRGVSFAANVNPLKHATSNDSMELYQLRPRPSSVSFGNYLPTTMEDLPQRAPSASMSVSTSSYRPTMTPRWMETGDAPQSTTCPPGLFSPNPKVTFAPPSKKLDNAHRSPSISKSTETLTVTQDSHATRRDLRLLIVEDDKTNQKVMQLMLKRLTGVVYDFANNGREGVDRFLETHEQQLPYDCIFMDNQMAVLNGEQATLEIRQAEEKRPEFGHTHVTALTANALMDENNQLFRTLVDDYLTKPISFHTFSTKIEDLKKKVFGEV
ncbi:two-component sensor, partial [Planoprotostelium fungivorum]